MSSTSSVEKRENGDKPKTPWSGLVLGYGGLIPFATGATLLCTGDTVGDLLPLSTVAFGMQAYGMSILSFIGGIHWGRVVQMSAQNQAQEDPSQHLRLLSFSVLPSLYGTATMFLPAPASLAALGVGIAGTLAFERAEEAQTTSPQFPSWYKTLRLVLAPGASLSLFASSGALLM